MTQGKAARKFCPITSSKGIIPGLTIGIVFCTLLLLFCSRPVRAEELPTFSTLALVMMSDEIWEADPLYFNAALILPEQMPGDGTDWLRVRLTKVLRSGFFKTGDTVWINTGSDIAWPHSKSRDRHMFPRQPDTISHLLLFGRGYTSEQYEEWYGKHPPIGQPAFVGLTLSGVRLLDRQGLVYFPWQTENPGSYHFLPDTSQVWSAIIGRTAYDIRRVDTLYHLRSIADPVEQNDSLLAWIARHEVELRNRNHPDHWELYRDLPFNWILSNNIYQQAWDAVLLHRRLFPDEILMHSEWPELGELPVPFHDFTGLQFLSKKISDETLEPALRGAAVRLFSDALQYIDLSDPERSQLFPDLRKSYAVLGPQDRHFCIYATAGLAFGYSGRKSVPDAMPFFTEARQLAAPGYLRNSVAEMIVRNCTAGEWKTISGNEGQVLVILSNFYYDSIKQTIRFGFRLVSGQEGLYEKPALQLHQLDSTGREYNVRELPYMVNYPKIDWQKGLPGNADVVALEVSVRDLPHGEWHFRFSGTAGAQQQYRWTSEPAVFSF